MANKESTAINALISMSQAGLSASGDDDLMFRPPSAPAPQRPPAQTLLGSMAPMAPVAKRSAGQSIPPLPSGGVRVSTAPQNRSPSVPPLPQRGLPPPRRPEGTPAPEMFRSTLTGPAVARPAAMPAQLPSRTATPANMPVAAPFDVDVDMQLDDASTPLPAPAPMAPSAPIVAQPQPAPMHAPPEQFESSWFQSSRMVEKIDESWSGTTPVGRIEAPRQFDRSKLVLPAIGVGIFMFFAIGYVAFDGEGPKHAAAAQVEPAKKTDVVAKRQPAIAGTKPAPVTNADPAATDTTKPPAAEPPKAEPPAPAPPLVEPPKAEPAKPDTAPVPTPVAANLVDVRFDSSPTGATVMLVDRGRSSFLGTTPVSASIDPSRKYDVVFTLDNHPTVLQHLDPKSTHHLAVALGGKPTHAAAPVATVEQPAAPQPKVEHAAPQPKVEQPRPHAQPAVAKQARPRPLPRRPAPATWAR